MLQPRRGRGAFKLIELAVVVILLGSLLALLLPALLQVREVANLGTCAWRLGRIHKAIQAHVDMHDFYPTGGNVYAAQRSWAFHFNDFAPEVPAIGAWQSWGWAYQILPHLSYEKQWKQVEWFKAGEVPPKLPQELPVAELQCPSRGGPRWVKYELAKPAVGLDYAGNGGPFAFVNMVNGEPRWPHLGPPNPGEVWIEEADNGVILPSRRLEAEPIRQPIGPRDVTDGLSHTLLVGEKCINALLRGQSQPGDTMGYCAGFSTDTVRTGAVPPTLDERAPIPVYDGFGSAHPAGWNALFADGSVRRLGYRMNPRPDGGGLTLMQRLCHRRDGGKFELQDLD